MNLEDFTPITVADFCALPSPRPEVFHIERHQGIVDQVDVLADHPDDSGQYAMRLTHKPCRFTGNAFAVLYLKRPS